MKVEVDVLGSPSLISLMVSVDVIQHEKRTALARRTNICRKALRVPKRTSVVPTDSQPHQHHQPGRLRTILERRRIKP